MLPSTPEEALAALAGHGPGPVRTLTYRGTVALILDGDFTPEPAAVAGRPLPAAEVAGAPEVAERPRKPVAPVTATRTG